MGLLPCRTLQKGKSEGIVIKSAWLILLQRLFRSRDRSSPQNYFFLWFTDIFYAAGDNTENYMEKARKGGSGVIKFRPITGGEM